MAKHLSYEQLVRHALKPLIRKDREQVKAWFTDKDKRDRADIIEKGMAFVIFSLMGVTASVLAIVLGAAWGFIAVPITAFTLFHTWRVTKQVNNPRSINDACAKHETGINLSVRAAIGHYLDSRIDALISQLRDSLVACNASNSGVVKSDADKIQEQLNSFTRLINGKVDEFRHRAAAIVGQVQVVERNGQRKSRNLQLAQDAIAARVYVLCSDIETVCETLKEMPEQLGDLQLLEIIVPGEIPTTEAQVSQTLITTAEQISLTATESSREVELNAAIKALEQEAQ